MGELVCCTFSASGTKTVEEIAKILGIGRTTCYRYIQSARETGS
ncbi:helix-turn-helix domain-containing protein [Pontibacter pamirensis]|nr:helix-turn-helix domain-containing protein [Pontibacter pamirensis]